VMSGSVVFGSSLAYWMTEQFPTELQYSAIALSYNVSQMIFGGTSSVVATAIGQISGGFEIAPAFYPAAMALLSGIILFLFGVREDRMKWKKKFAKACC